MCTVCVCVCECVSVSVLCVIYFMAHAVDIILCVGCWVFRVMLFCNSFFGLNLKELCRNISVELYKIQRIKTVSSFWNVIDTFLSQCFRKVCHKVCYITVHLLIYWWCIKNHQGAIEQLLPCREAVAVGLTNNLVWFCFRVSLPPLCLPTIT